MRVNFCNFAQAMHALASRVFRKSGKHGFQHAHNMAGTCRQISCKCVICGLMCCGRYLQAAAAVVLSGSAQGGSAPALRLLARAPVRDPSPSMTRLAAFAWHWVAAAVPGCLVRASADAPSCYRS